MQVSFMLFKFTNFFVKSNYRETEKSASYKPIYNNILSIENILNIREYHGMQHREK